MQTITKGGSSVLVDSTNLVRIGVFRTNAYLPHTQGVENNEINFKNVVGKKVRALRREAALSQETLADRCGIFRTYLSRIESGSANPSIGVLVALANSLSVSPHELFMHD